MMNKKVKSGRGRDQLRSARAVLMGLLVVVSLVLPPMPVALRVVSMALGDVRTTVPVLLPGTAWRLASAAVAGVTPTAVFGWFATVPGMLVVPVVPLVCAKAATLPTISAAASNTLVLFKVVMIEVSPVGLRQITSFVSTHADCLDEILAGVEGTLKQPAQRGCMN